MERHHIRFAEVKLFCDNSKIVKIISKIKDCEALQQDYMTFVSFSVNFGLTVNQTKFKMMTISRSRNLIYKDYYMNGKLIERVNKFNDLGLVFNSKLNFFDE